MWKMNGTCMFGYVGVTVSGHVDLDLGVCSGHNNLHHYLLVLYIYVYV